MQWRLYDKRVELGPGGVINRTNSERHPEGLIRNFHINLTKSTVRTSRVPHFTMKSFFFYLFIFLHYLTSFFQSVLYYYNNTIRIFVRLLFLEKWFQVHIKKRFLCDGRNKKRYWFTLNNCTCNYNENCKRHNILFSEYNRLNSVQCN